MRNIIILFTCIIFYTYASVQRPRADRDSQTKKRNTDHIDEILLRPDPIGYDDDDPNIQAVFKELGKIYQNMIRPVEKQFKYADLRRHTMSDVDIYAKPIILLVGPWSTGKSTMINYLLGIEGNLESLYVGAEPTTGDFTVLSYGDDYRTVEGVVLATDATKPFASMEKFGQIFLEHLLGVEMNKALLRNVSFIDTPGILENRRQQERGYPYNDVMRWLVHRSDLIFVVFDPTKLDVGYELETLFKQLKGKESVLRIILNKADSIPEQELMRVYGALFWSLSPLINVTEPPRVYVGSFWSEPFHDDDLSEILLREEKSLLHDMREVIRNRVYNKIAFVRQYAIRVRIHALLVDSYVSAYRRNKGLFGGSDELAKQIVEDPESYDVFKTVLSHPNISKYDLPDPEEYEEFFRINPLQDQRRISEHCGYFSGCALDLLNGAIGNDLPVLLRRFRSPNEGGRRGQKRQQQKPFDRPEFMPASEIKATLEAVKKHAGAKKYRKSTEPEKPTVQDEIKEETESSTSKESAKRKSKFSGEVQKSVTKAASKSSKPKQKNAEKPIREEVKKPPVASASMKDHPKKVKKSKEKRKYEEETEPTPTPQEPIEAVVPELEPEPSPLPIISNEPIEIDISEEIPEEPPAPPPPSKSKTQKVTSHKERPNPHVDIKSKKIIEKPQGHKGTEVPAPSPPSAEGVKCNKYRKSCPENEEIEKEPEPVKVAELPHKGTSKRKESDVDKKSAAKKAVPQPTPPPSSKPSSKCNKFRKSCQDEDENEKDNPAPKSTHAKKAEPVAKSAKPAPKPAAVPAVIPMAVSPPSGSKCNKFKKSCQTDDESVAPKVTEKKPEKPDVKKGVKKEAPAKAPESESVLVGQKCNKYRKDCKSTDDEEIPKKESVKKDAKKDQKQVPKPPSPVQDTIQSEGPKKCNKYRKGCQSESEDDTPSLDQRKSKKIEPESNIDSEESIEVNCGRYSYRRSCGWEKGDQFEDATITQPKEASTKKQETHAKKHESAPLKWQKPKEPSKKAEVKKELNLSSLPTGNGNEKCNKYRKSCQTDKDDDEPIQKPSSKKEEKPIKATQVHVSETPSPNGAPCNKYRKSCKDTNQEINSKPAAKIEEKPKKLCKKNATTSAASKSASGKSDKANPAPAPAPGNTKYRKQKT